MSSVVVLTGAGASRDCAGDAPAIGPAPPLVRELFASTYEATLAQYPLVQQAAVDLRRATSEQPDAVGLEAYLRDTMRASTSTYAQRRYRQVPLYLQDVLEQASAFTMQPANYNALLNAALDLDDVLFLTLNYDTLLDDRLAEYAPLQDLDWYTRTDDRWALIKLHGSVNWGWPLELESPKYPLVQTIQSMNLAFDNWEGQFEFSNDDIQLRKGRGVANKRYDGLDSKVVYYPALAVPLGEEDEMVCPATHLDEARRRLVGPDGLDLLVIGYSGIDREVLRLFTESGNEIRRLLVVDGSSGASDLAAERIAKAFRQPFRPEWATARTFSEFVSSGELQRWMNDASAR